MIPSKISLFYGNIANLFFLLILNLNPSILRVPPNVLVAHFFIKRMLKIISSIMEIELGWQTDGLKRTSFSKLIILAGEM
jgi:hypothetical protein